MNQSQLVSYMKEHNLLAKINKPDTLEAAKALEARGIISKVGVWDGPNPGIIYHVTQRGMETLFPDAIRPSPLVQLKDALGGTKLPERPIVG